jgi:hypothetical protein
VLNKGLLYIIFVLRKLWNFERNMQECVAATILQYMKTINNSLEKVYHFEASSCHCDEWPGRMKYTNVHVVKLKRKLLSCYNILMEQQYCDTLHQVRLQCRDSHTLL